MTRNDPKPRPPAGVTTTRVGSIDNSGASIHRDDRAELIFRQKSVLSDEAILELVIWRVPEAVTGSEHRYKYRLFYGRAGERIVGYDNERLKGDHRHVDGEETPYAFTTVDALVGDFLAEVAARRPK